MLPAKVQVVAYEKPLGIGSGSLATVMIVVSVRN